MNRQVDLILKNCSELLTIAGAKPKNGRELKNPGLINNGAVAIRGKKIIWVGESNELDLDGKKIIDCSGKVVMPGFVDCHTHAIFAGSREKELELKIQGKSYMEILESGYGIYSTVEAMRAASPEVLKNLCAARLGRMLRNGTTTVEIKSGYGLNMKDELKCMTVMRALQSEQEIDIVPTFLGAHAVPIEYKNSPDAYVDMIIRNMLPEIASKKLAEFCDVFCEPDIFNIDQSRKILTEAKKLGFKLKLHADEFTNSGGAELAAELGATSADHLLKSSEQGIKEMAKKGVIGVLLPGASFTNFLEYASARKYIELGLPIALATDFNPSCWIDNIGFVIALACYKMKILPAEAISACTINAAFAIGKEKEVGSIEVGKKADLVIFDIDNYQSIPYKLGLNLIDKVVKSGKIAFESEK